MTVAGPLTAIPKGFGSGGAGLYPNGGGSSSVAGAKPTLEQLLNEHRAALLLLQGESAHVDQIAKAASTGNLTLSGAQTVDGTALVAGDHVLAKNQSTASQNGLYVVASGAWTRVVDDDGTDVRQAGLVVQVGAGSVNGGAQFILAADLTTWSTTTSAALSSSTPSALGTAAAGSAVTASKSDHVHALPSSNLGVHFARGVVTANVADLANFTVAGNDGLTYTAGQRVLLVGQTTKSQNGVYVVGTVGVGVAPLTRPIDWTAANILPPSAVVEIMGGTMWVGTKWKVTTAGPVTVDTTAIDLYPVFVGLSVTLVNGTINIANVPIFSATKTVYSIRRITPVGTANTIQYNPAAAATPGIIGTASVDIQAQVAAGTINAADGSTLIVGVHNF